MLEETVKLGGEAPPRVSERSKVVPALSCFRGTVRFFSIDYNIKGTTNCSLLFLFGKRDGPPYTIGTILNAARQN